MCSDISSECFSKSSVICCLESCQDIRCMFVPNNAGWEEIHKILLVAPFSLLFTLLMILQICAVSMLLSISL